MALMFSRLAHNFIKNGYFPTDDETLTRILAALQPAGQHMRIVDPCCGEGTALAHVKHHLQQGGESVQALGVEFDAERAWHAKKLLDAAIHADIADVSLSRRSCGLLYLNPPYGHAVADKAQLGDATKSERLELIHLRRNFDCLQVGGVLVLIVPYYVLDETMAALLARNFERLQVFMAPEERFKQCVVLGVRRRSGYVSATTAARLLSAGRGEQMNNVLPSTWSDEPYQVPEQSADDGFNFHAIRIDAKQLGEELSRLHHQTLWPQFGQTFVQVRQEHRPPLRPLSRWHLALALAAGQITGMVTASNGRRLLIKGDTFKNKARTVERNVDDDGNVSETVVLTDRFVPIIRGIDMSPGPKLGQIVTIR